MPSSGQFLEKQRKKVAQGPFFSGQLLNLKRHGRQAYLKQQYKNTRKLLKK